MKSFIVFCLSLILALSSFSPTQGNIPLKEIRTSPDALASADAHIQGISCNDDAIFVSFKNMIFKIDWLGNVLKSVSVQPHAGDLTCVDGHIFVSMSEPEKHGVFEYDSELNLLKKYKLENTSATDGIAFLNGNFFIGGPSIGQTPHFDNRVCRFDRKFNLVQEMFVNFGVPTHYGTQAIEAYGGTLFMAFYVADDAEIQTIRTDDQMRIIEKYPLFTGNGIVRVPPSKQNRDNPLFLVARTENTKEGNPVAILRWFELDEGNFIDITDE